MNKIIQKLSAFLILISALTILSCKKDVEKPGIVKFIANPTTQVAGTPIVFTIQHTGDYAAIWTGEKKHNYFLYQEQIANPPDEEKNVVGTYDYGATVLDTVYRYTYRTPGVYQVVVISTNAGDKGEAVETTVSEPIEVTIVEAN